MRAIFFPRPALLLALALVSLSGCGKGGGATDGSDAAAFKGKQPIVVGHFASMSGDTASFGQSADEGIRLAAAQINAAGGVMGRPVKVVTADDASKATEARTAAQKLIERDGAVALLGEIASSRSIAAAPVADDLKVPMLSPASTNPKVTVDDAGKVRPFVFRACFIDPFQGTAMATFAMNPKPDGLGLKKFAVLYPNNSDYGTGLTQYFKKAVADKGGTVVAEESYAEKQDKDFKGQLTKIKAANPEAIYVPGYYTEVGLIALQARELGLNVPLLGGDGWDSKQTVATGGKAVEGCYFTNHISLDSDRPEVQSFVKAYHAKYGDSAQPDAMTVLGYDAMKLLADAVSRAKSTDGPAVRDALADTSDFAGASGAISINETHDSVKPLVVLEIRDRKFVYVATVKPEAAE